MNLKIAVFVVSLIGVLSLQSCSKPDTGPKTTVEITLLEEVEANDVMAKWLQEFVKKTTGEKGKVEVVSGGKALTIEIPAAALGDVRAALKMWEGPRADGFGMHAVKPGTPEQAKAVAAGTEIIADHTALPLRSSPGEFRIIKSDSVIKSAEIKSASPHSGPNGWEISVQFTPAGSKKMGTFTTAHRGNPIALVLNGEILSAPIVNEPFSDSCRITGNFTKEEAAGLANGMSRPPSTKFQLTPKATPLP